MTYRELISKAEKFESASRTEGFPWGETPSWVVGEHGDLQVTISPDDYGRYSVICRFSGGRARKPSARCNGIRRAIRVANRLLSNKKH